MKKTLALILSLCMILALFVGCSEGTPSATTPKPDGNTPNPPATTPKPDGKAEAISLKVWVPEEEMELTHQLCDAFNAAHPEWDISFDISITGIDESVNSLETDPELAADVMQVPSGSIAQIVNEGLVLPITYDIDNVSKLYGEGAMNSTAATTDVGTFYYALPFSPNSYFMYYNKDLYTEEEVKSLETMMAKDLGEGFYNFSTDMTNSWYIESFFFAAGCTLFGDDGTDPTQCTFNSADGLAATKYIIDLVNNPKYVETGDGVEGALFLEGKLGAFTSGTWAMQKDDPVNGMAAVMGDKLGAVALPTIQINGKEAHLSNFADYKTFAVKSSTKQPLAAQLLVEFLCNEESQLARYQAVAATPTVLSLADNEAVKNDIGTAALLAQTEFATAQPNIPQINNYWTPMQTLGESIVLRNEVNDSNMQATLDKVVADILSTGLGG